jgi:glutamate transport system substrate-binding protein
MLRKSIGRRPFLVAALASTAIAMAGCSGGTGLPAELAGSGSSGASDTFLKNAPVAADGLILPGSTMETIRKRGKLIVATALDAPLISQQDPLNPDNVTGLDAEMAKLLATYILGKPDIQWVPSAAETREAMLANGTVDVVFATYTITEKRAKQISFAGPYFMSGLAVAVKSDTTSIEGIDDLANKSVIVQTGSPAVNQMPEKQPSAKLTPFATTPQGIEALTQGRGDAFVQDYALLASQASTNKNIKVVGQPFTHEPYGIGLKHNDQQFKDFINTWLKATYDGGQWAKVWKGTLGTVSGATVPEPPAIGSVPGS